MMTRDFNTSMSNIIKIKQVKHGKFLKYLTSSNFSHLKRNQIANDHKNAIVPFFKTPLSYVFDCKTPVTLGKMFLNNLTQRMV